MTKNTAPEMAWPHPRLIMIPTIAELSGNALQVLTRKLIDSANHWGIRHAGFEYVTTTLPDNAGEYARVADAFQLQAPATEYERLVPVISTKCGSNEGFQVHISLDRYPKAFASEIHLSLHLLFCKVWNRDAQHGLADHFNEILCW